MDPIPALGFADPLSSVSHLLGAAVFAVLGTRLWLRARACGRAPGAFAIYVTSVVLALAASAAFHGATRGSEVRDLLMSIDHATIFVLIAGSYTPIHMVQFSGAMRWGVLAVVWTAALAGVLAKLLLFDAIPEWFGLSLYLGLGWAGLFSAANLYRKHGLRSLTMLIVGALAYTFGALLEFARVPVLIDGVIGPHEVFHGFVLLGIAAHWRYITGLLQRPAKVSSLPNPAF